MKKVSFALVACVTLLMTTLFVSCNDDNNNQPENPIEGLELPRSDVDNPIQSGQTVEIKGTGFSSSCEVWLQSVATRTEPEVVKVDVTVTSTGISFVVPTLTGRYDVVLKQDGESYTLGTLFLTTPVDESVEHLFAASVNYGVNPGTTFYEYDSSADKFVEYGKVQGDLWKAVLSAENGMIYYFKDEGLFSYDLNKKIEKQLLDNHWLAKQTDYIIGTGQAIGLIDGELHGVKYSQKDGFTVVKIGDDGKETVVKEFPAFDAAEGDGKADFFCEDDNLLFVYDEISKTIVLIGWEESTDGKEPYATIVSLGLNESMPYTLIDDELDYSMMKVGDQFWLALVGEKTVFKQINDLKKFTGMELTTGLEKEELYSPVYGKASHTIYFTGDDDELKKYNVTTKQVTESKATLPTIECLFIAKY